MRLRFRSTRLRRAYERSDHATRRWGPDVARRYVTRLNTIQAVQRWEDLFNRPELGLHPLHGDRRGEFAIRLTGRWRLIVVPSEDGDEITIINVEDYHG